MDRALFTLMLLQAKAAVRRAVRGVRTPRGAAFFAVGVLVFGLWLGPVLFSTLMLSRSPAATIRTDPRQVRELMPALLLIFCVASLFSTADKAVSFSPGEVNFLFAGPFTRRQLLGFKLTKAALGSLVTALLLSLVLRRHTHSWPATFVGTFLSLMLMQLFATCLVLVAQTISQHAYSLARRAVLFVVIGAAAVALRPAFTASAAGEGEGASGIDTASLLRRFSDSRAGRVVLAPFQPFARAFTAEALFPDLLKWALAAAAVDGALVLLVLKMDANYLEAAAAASQRVYERAQRVRRGDWTPTFGRRRAGEGDAAARRPARLRLPPFPWLGGAGPVAWRQLTAVAHKSAGIVLMLAVYGGVIAVSVVAGRRAPDVRAVLFPAVVWLTLLLSGALRFDFRGDLDQIPWLKSLPLRPAAVAAGQLVTPVLLLTVCHLALFAAGAAVSVPARPALAVMGVLALPFNVVLLGVENVLFLLFPARGPAAPGEVSAVGRQVVLFVVKLLTVATAATVAGGIGLAAFALSRLPAVALAAAFLALGAEGAALVPAVAWAYRRFDPSADTPP